MKILIKWIIRAVIPVLTLFILRGLVFTDAAMEAHKAMNLGDMFWWAAVVFVGLVTLVAAVVAWWANDKMIEQWKVDYLTSIAGGLGK